MKKVALRIMVLVGVLVLLGGCGDSKSDRIKKMIKELSIATPNQGEVLVKKLAAEGDEAIQPLLNAMERNKKAKVRGYCALALVRLGAEEAKDPIRKMLFEDESPEARAFAAQALAEFLKAEAVPDLVKSLKQDKDATVRPEVRKQLVSKELSSAARRELLPLLRDKDVDIRDAARKTISDMGPDSIPDLIAIFPSLSKDSQDDWILLTDIFQALVDIGDVSVKPQMREIRDRFLEYDNKEKGITTKRYKKLENLYNKL